MIVFMQKHYEPNDNNSISYKKIFNDFIGFKKSNQSDCFNITFDKYGFLICEALGVAFCERLKTISDPVALSYKKDSVILAN